MGESAIASGGRRLYAVDGNCRGAKRQGNAGDKRRNVEERKAKWSARETRRIRLHAIKRINRRRARRGRKPARPSSSAFPARAPYTTPGRRGSFGLSGHVLYKAGQANTRRRGRHTILKARDPHPGIPRRDRLRGDSPLSRRQITAARRARAQFLKAPEMTSGRGCGAGAAFQTAD